MVNLEPTATSSVSLSELSSLDEYLGDGNSTTSSGHSSGQARTNDSNNNNSSGSNNEGQLHHSADHVNNYSEAVKATAAFRSVETLSTSEDKSVSVDYNSAISQNPNVSCSPASGFAFNLGQISGQQPPGHNKSSYNILTLETPTAVQSHSVQSSLKKIDASDSNPNDSSKVRRPWCCRCFIKSNGSIDSCPCTYLNIHCCDIREIAKLVKNQG